MPRYLHVSQNAASDFGRLVSICLWPQIHAVTFWWGFRGVVLVLMHEMREKRLLTARFWNPATRQEIPSTPAIVAQVRHPACTHSFPLPLAPATRVVLTHSLYHACRLQYFIVHEGALCGVAALAGVMAIVITGFLAYHLYLVSRNMTTNETFKWTAVRRVYKAEREKRDRAKEISGEHSAHAGLSAYITRYLVCMFTT